MFWLSVQYCSGMQEICNQIKKREEEQQYGNELKEFEKLQLQEKQEQMNLKFVKMWQHYWKAAVLKLGRGNYY